PGHGQGALDGGGPDLGARDALEQRLLPRDERGPPRDQLLVVRAQRGEHEQEHEVERQGEAERAAGDAPLGGGGGGARVPGTRLHGVVGHGSTFLPARSFADLALGLRATSSSEAVTGFLVRTSKRGLSRRKRLTMRSSREW